MQQSFSHARPQGHRATIKWVALLTMIIDHVGVIFLPQVRFLRVIGRIAFPLYCWGIVMGVDHTKSLPRYALRLLVLAVLSQLPYMLALHHSLDELNAIFTLLFGMLGLWGLKEKRFGSQYWAPALALAAGILLKMDYGWKGIAVILLMYAARKDGAALSAVMVAFSLFWGQNTIGLRSVFSLPARFMGQSASHPIDMVFDAVFRLQTLAALALPFILCPKPVLPRCPRWLSLLGYPLHLLLLYLLQFVI